MKILNFGSCNIDYVYAVPHFVLPGETLSASRCDQFPGGKGLNQSVAVANAGCPVYHAGCIGEDGLFLKNLLQSKGVNTDFLKVLPQKTGHAIIEVDGSGENRILIFSGTNGWIREETVDEVLRSFSENDLLMLQNEISCRNYLLKRAAELKLKVVFNPAPFTDDITYETLSGISYLIVNKNEACRLTGESDAGKIIEAIRLHLPACKVVLTLGEKGCCYFDQNTVIKQNAFSVEPVDTTAAGDTFIGYFVAGIVHGIPLKENLLRSCAASALCVMKPGASSAIPTASEVKKAVSKLKERITDPFAERLEAYCRQHTADGNLGAFAAELNYSVQYISKKTRQITGTSFVSYLQQYRLERAAHLLEKTDLSVEEIIRQCGYTNSGYFRKLFEKKYGCRPLHYRKRGD